jgi:molecular chaperone GrpE (heat shock protein)
MTSLPEHVKTLNEESLVRNDIDLVKKPVEFPTTEPFVAEQVTAEPNFNGEVYLTLESESEVAELPTTDDGQILDKPSETAEPVSVVPAKDISTEIAKISVLLWQLAKDFETKLKYDATKQAQIDRLYNENQSFKEGLLKKFRHSMILAVIEQIDDAAKVINHFNNTVCSEDNYRKLLDSYQEVATGFQDVLQERFDVKSYYSESDSQFDPQRQRMLKKYPVNDQSKHKLVKQSLRPGYETDDGFILRPEMVEVYVFDSQQSVT